ncbi:hypothetical protein ACFLZK_00310 [Patescibacteria group bacterium]
MNITLRYVPPIKGVFLTLVLISFFPVVLGVYIAFVKFGVLAILLFTLVYAFIMIYVFVSLSKSHYIEINEEKNSLIIHKTFKSIEISFDIISLIDLAETKRSYLLSIGTKQDDSVRNYSLSGSLSFEEPPFVPFLRKLRELKPIIQYGPYCEETLRGSSDFNPWSKKMYFSYWTYITLLIAYYLSLLIFINILK